MSTQTTVSLATVEQAQEMGLRPEEFEKIKEILGRTPNFTELSVFWGNVVRTLFLQIRSSPS